MSDYKYGAQLIAEELAWERYETDLYSLPEDVQLELYDAGLNSYVERRLP